MKTDNPAEINNAIDDILKLMPIHFISHYEETADHKLSFNCDGILHRFELRTAVERLMAEKYPLITYQTRYNANDLILSVEFL